MNNQNQTPLLTALSAAHLPQAVDLSSEMGWPYRIEDWAFAYRLGAGLALEQAGRLIGTAMRWDYGDALTSIGMVIVAKACQGRGYGARLVDELLAGTGSRSVFLNATQEGLELYRRRGFTCTGELNQHQGVPVVTESGSRQAQIRTADASDLPLILKLDRDALGMPRTELLEGLLAAGQLLVLSDRGAANAYAACRAFGRGHVIGPVVATRVEDARALIEAAMSQLPCSFIRVDTDATSGLGPWLEARGLKRVDTAISMVRGALPSPSGHGRVFALCSQSLG
jgi:GNAT superfamily N-acetyltransferase